MKGAIILTLLAAAATVRPQPLPNDIVFAGNDRIYVVRANGTGQTAITSSVPNTNRPRWSRDGKQIVFTTGDLYQNYNSSIWKMNADGSNQTFVLTLGEASRWYIPWQPVFSPNADRIAFVGYDDYELGDAIATVDSNGGSWHFITHTYTRWNGLDWSPTGEKLIYSELAIEQNTQFYRISSINSDGTGRLALTTRSQGRNIDPVWSPDGSKIAFVSDRDGNWEIYTMNSDGSNQSRVTNSTAGDLYPSWSPDGTKLAFSSNRNGPYNVYVINDDGTNAVQITHNAFDSVSPNWNPKVALHRATNFDFDGDGRSDVSVFRPSDSVWYLDRSFQGFSAIQFGIPTDLITTSDYDGDGKTDIAVFRDGVWWYIDSSSSTVRTVQFGSTGEVAVPADYTGDGRDELAVYRGGQWWKFDLSTGQASVVNLGLATGKPVPADYDGDGKADLAVFRPSDGGWWIDRSAAGLTVKQFGVAGDRPVVCDYDGDGKADIAEYRDGTWYVDYSLYGPNAIQWGLATDIPVPADYDGDGRADLAVYRDGVWYIYRSSDSSLDYRYFGLGSDIPIPSVTGR